MARNRVRRRDRERPAGEAGVGDESLRLRGDPLDGVPGVRGHLEPLKGRLQNAGPPLGGLGRDTDLASELGAVHFLRRESRREADEAAELLPVGDVGQEPCVALDVRPLAGHVEIRDRFEGQEVGLREEAAPEALVERERTRRARDVRPDDRLGRVDPCREPVTGVLHCGGLHQREAFEVEKSDASREALCDRSQDAPLLGACQDVLSRCLVSVDASLDGGEELGRVLDLVEDEGRSVILEEEFRVLACPGDDDGREALQEGRQAMLGLTREVRTRQSVCRPDVLRAFVRQEDRSLSTPPPEAPAPRSPPRPTARTRRPRSPPGRRGIREPRTGGRPGGGRAALPPVGPS